MPASDTFGNTPLHLAVWAGYEDVVQTLLAAGASVAAASADGSTPLHVAINYGFTALATRLLSAGASLLAVDKQMMSPLQAAAQSGDTAFVMSLVQAAPPIVNHRLDKTVSLQDIVITKGCRALMEQLTSRDCQLAWM